VTTRPFNTNSDYPGEKYEFEAPEPPLQPGEVLEFGRHTTTLGGKNYAQGDTLTLIRRTDEVPFKHNCSLGNWVVETKYNLGGTPESIWSNIDMMVSEGLLKRHPKPRSRYERLMSDPGATHVEEDDAVRS